jgi:hypothetical protein
LKILLLAAAIVWSNQLPIPPQYQKNTQAWITVMNQAQIDKKCGKAAKGGRTLACGDVKRPFVYMPNPCLYPEAQDKKSYAHLLCHELAHVQGWTHDKD